MERNTLFAWALLCQLHHTRQSFSENWPNNLRSLRNATMILKKWMQKMQLKLRSPCLKLNVIPSLSILSEFILVWDSVFEEPMNLNVTRPMLQWWSETLMVSIGEPRNLNARAKEHPSKIERTSFFCRDLRPVPDVLPESSRQKYDRKIWCHSKELVARWL